ncbi:MAG: PQQ-like beta-propeller repeat protein [Caldisericia bacterium]|nr:PQQ-like beta-propeller repeat protein [Caldisericia bacterium]
MKMIKPIFLAIIAICQIITSNIGSDMVLSEPKVIKDRYPLLVYDGCMLIEKRIFQVNNPGTEDVESKVYESNLDLIDLKTLKSVWSQEPNQLKNDLEAGKIQFEKDCYLLHDNYLMIRNKGTTCYNLDNGKRLWHNKTLEELPENDAINDNDFAYIICYGGDEYYPKKLIEIDIRNGYVRRKFDLSKLTKIEFFPYILGNDILNVSISKILFYLDNTMYYFDLSSEKILHKFKEPVYVNGNIFNNVLVLNNLDFSYTCDDSTRRLKAINLDNGKELWNQECGDEFLCNGNLAYYQEPVGCDANKQYFLSCKDIINGNVLSKIQIDRFAGMSFFGDYIALESLNKIVLYDKSLTIIKEMPVISMPTLYTSDSCISIESINVSDNDDIITYNYNTFIYGI